MLFDAEDEGRAAAGKLQRWGLEAAMAVIVQTLTEGGRMESNHYRSNMF